ncbi:MAG TPA: PP2C family protein-serine/threonine phosphatase [Acidobacteriaceae bacterium]|nr:PP2C family protein-serine/threonine phosphatase [Acidobacteriaceae bacterium]
MANTMAGQSFSGRADRFWQRVTDGMQLSQLWEQFRADARSSYRLYSNDVDQERRAGESQGRHALHMAGKFFWAVMEKLTPARRLLLLIGLVLLFSGIQGVWQSANGLWIRNSFWGGLLLLALLLMEVGDRVVMKRDLQIAKEIQAWLLPSSPPAVPGLAIAFATRAANTVAGDYYDIFPRPGCEGPNPTFLIAIADVAGKSVPAAMLMATFQASLKTLSAACTSLADLVPKINTYACTNSQNGRRFTTAFIAEFDPSTRMLTYINAGHNSPILLRASGAVERLQAGGMPLGVMDQAPYQSAAVTLQPGDWVAAFTDGVIEAENPVQAQYGEDRLLTMLRWGAAMPPQALLDTILADITRFAQNAPQHDDITCMLLRAA